MSRAVAVSPASQPLRLAHGERVLRKDAVSVMVPAQSALSQCSRCVGLSVRCVSAMKSDIDGAERGGQMETRAGGEDADVGSAAPGFLIAGSRRPLGEPSPRMDGAAVPTTSIGASSNCHHHASVSNLVRAVRY